MGPGSPPVLDVNTIILLFYFSYRFNVERPFVGCQPESVLLQKLQMHSEPLNPAAASRKWSITPLPPKNLCRAAESAVIEEGRRHN